MPVTLPLKDFAPTVPPAGSAARGVARRLDEGGSDAGAEGHLEVALDDDVPALAAVAGGGGVGLIARPNIVTVLSFEITVTSPPCPFCRI